MSFNIKTAFVSRSTVEADKETQIDPDRKEEVVIQEAYDPRTLYERLQEQRNLKEEKFAEESRLSNQIKRIDEEEAEYFRTLSDEKEKLEYQRRVKEQLDLEEYRQAVESTRSNHVAQIPTLDASLSKPKPLKKTKNNDALKGALFMKKKKRDSEDEEKPTEKKLKTQDTPTGSLGLLSAYGDISSSDSEEDS